MPSERRDNGYQRVLKGICVVVITYENVERKGDIDGKPSPVQREFKLVPVIDISVEIIQF
jgi:hypothetical protein